MKIKEAENMDMILGFTGYFLLFPYTGISKYDYAVLFTLFVFAVWSLLVDFFCTYKMVKPLKVTLKTIFIFVLSLKFIELITGFFKPVLVLVLGSVFLVVTQVKAPSEKLFAFILINLATVIITFIKIIVARSYFTALPRKQVIKWMLIASFVGFFVPRFIASFYFNKWNKEIERPYGLHFIQ